ncbi:hypothetical protein GCM10010321_33850 [Streptomyces chartreusis]|nr:hypothetical protein GCM10010321_33850 [Streptomyces chartreusis]
MNNSGSPSTCDGSNPAVEQVSESFVSGLAILLGVLREEQSGPRFNLRPCQTAASVFGASNNG